VSIRGPYDLSQELESALAWRKKELSALLLLIQGKVREHEREALRRAAVPILYAHWEGFAKWAAERYLELVDRQKLRHCDLRTNFIALACRGSLREAALSAKTHIYSQLVDFLVLNQDDRCRVPYKGTVSTSNLNSEVLRDIFFTIGLDYGGFWTSKEPLLDGSLLRIRNEIAHGSRVPVDQATYEQLHYFVIDLTSNLKDAIENAAIQKAYLRKPPK
jgi:hypothetical protein